MYTCFLVLVGRINFIYLFILFITFICIVILIIIDYFLLSNLYNNDSIFTNTCGTIILVQLLRYTLLPYLQLEIYILYNM